MIAYEEYKLNIVSPISSNENCLKVWENSPDDYIVQNYPNRGAIAIWRSTNASVKNAKESENPKRSFEYIGRGHTAIVIEYNPDIKIKTMTTVEGNTNYEGSSNGDGVFKKNNRNKIKEGGISDLAVVGFLIPFKKI